MLSNPGEQGATENLPLPGRAPYSWAEASADELLDLEWVFNYGRLTGSSGKPFKSTGFQPGPCHSNSVASGQLLQVEHPNLNR